MYHLFTLLFLLTTAVPTTTLTVDFYNVKQAKGSLHLAVFDSDATFSAKHPAVYETTVAISGTNEISVEIPALTAGKTYAIAAYQDLNNNGELDTNLLGIPTEPYAFSNNPKVKWQAPTFAETTFKAGERRSMRLRLATWSDQ